MHLVSLLFILEKTWCYSLVLQVYYSKRYWCLVLFSIISHVFLKGLVSFKLLGHCYFLFSPNLVTSKLIPLFFIVFQATPKLSSFPNYTWSEFWTSQSSHQTFLSPFPLLTCGRNLSTLQIVTWIWEGVEKNNRKNSGFTWKPNLGKITGWRGKTSLFSEDYSIFYRGKTPLALSPRYLIYPGFLLIVRVMRDSITTRFTRCDLS